MSTFEDFMVHAFFLPMAAMIGVGMLALLGILAGWILNFITHGDSGVFNLFYWTIGRVCGFKKTTGTDCDDWFFYQKNPGKGGRLNYEEDKWTGPEFALVFGTIIVILVEIYSFWKFYPAIGAVLATLAVLTFVARFGYGTHKTLLAHMKDTNAHKGE